MKHWEEGLREGAEELEKLAQDAAQESHQPSMSLRLPQSLPPPETLMRCLLCCLAVVAGGCLSLRAATSATCSSSCCCCCCCLSTVWFLLLCFCVWFARGKVNNSSKRQQNLLNYYLPLLLYLTLHGTQGAHGGGGGGGGLVGGTKLGRRGCNPFSMAKFTFASSREKVTRWKYVTKSLPISALIIARSSLSSPCSLRMRSPRIEIISAVTGTSINGDFCTFKCRNSH